MSRTGPRYGRSGFTLVETLCAFVILSTLSLVVLQAFVGSRAGLDRAEAWLQAEAVARTLLEAPLASGASAGARNSGATDGREWTLVAEPLPLPAAEVPGDEPSAWKPMRVTVRVAVARGVTFEVETVRLAKAPAG